MASQRHEDRSGFPFKIPGWADSIAAQPRTGNGGALPLSLLKSQRRLIMLTYRKKPIPKP